MVSDLLPFNWKILAIVCLHAYKICQVQFSQILYYWFQLYTADSSGFSFYEEILFSTLSYHSHYHLSIPIPPTLSLGFNSLGFSSLGFNSLGFLEIPQDSSGFLRVLYGSLGLFYKEPYWAIRNLTEAQLTLENTQKFIVLVWIIKLLFST